jgi:RNA polymerase sigma-70 factor (ECF subfamily)
LKASFAPFDASRVVGGEWRPRVARPSEELSATVNKHEAIIAELPRLRRYARALVRDADTADDLVQDCVERSLSRLYQFRAGTDMRSWLFTIMHSIFVNGVSRRKFMVGLDELNPDHEVGLATPPEQGQGLVMRDLEAALARLSDEHREVVILVGLENMTYKQAADIIGVPLGTVMSRLARGRERLGQLMGGDDLIVLRQAK